MGNSSSVMGNGSSDCHGNHPGEIRELKDIVGNNAKYVMDNANEIQGYIDTFYRLTNDLNKYKTQILDIIYKKIPDKERRRIFYVENETNIQNQNIDNITKDISLNTIKLQNLNDNIIKSKSSLSFVSAASNTQNRNVAAVTGQTTTVIKQNEYTTEQFYQTIESENKVITDSINNNNIFFSKDNTRILNTTLNLNNVVSIRVWLYICYYILILFIIVVFIYKNNSNYYIIAFIIILLIYPIIIYTIQSYIHNILLYFYSHLRFSPPENI